jgi:hypothetical protein
MAAQWPCCFHDIVLLLKQPFKRRMAWEDSGRGEEGASWGVGVLAEDGRGGHTMLNHIRLQEHTGLTCDGRIHTLLGTDPSHRAHILWWVQRCEGGCDGINAGRECVLVCGGTCGLRHLHSAREKIDKALEPGGGMWIGQGWRTPSPTSSTMPPPPPPSHTHDTPTNTIHTHTHLDFVPFADSLVYAFAPTPGPSYLAVPRLSERECRAHCFVVCHLWDGGGSDGVRRRCNRACDQRDPCSVWMEIMEQNVRAADVSEQKHIPLSLAAKPP